MVTGLIFVEVVPVVVRVHVSDGTRVLEVGPEETFVNDFFFVVGVVISLSIGDIGHLAITYWPNTLGRSANGKQVASIMQSRNCVASTLSW